MAVPDQLRTGLNPYGLTWHLGLQGRGTPRGNPVARGLDGFIDIATRLRAEVIEIHNPWLVGQDLDLGALRDRLRTLGLTPVISAFLEHEPIEPAIANARALGATTVRVGLSSVLCGDRARRADWKDMVARVRDTLKRLGPLAGEHGIHLALENHQDFGSAELMAFCHAAGEAVGITMDTGNAWPVAESPLLFAQTVAPRIRHVHLKDYRVQMTDEGYRLVRCAIGDGAAPLKAIMAILLASGRPLTASLEPGALEARHVRLLTPEWWDGYAPKTAVALAECLHSARPNRLAEDADYRTPWESERPGAEIEAYELAMIEKSAANVRALGLMR